MSQNVNNANAEKALKIAITVRQQKRMDIIASCIV